MYLERLIRDSQRVMDANQHNSVGWAQASRIQTKAHLELEQRREARRAAEVQELTDDELVDATAEAARDLPDRLLEIYVAEYERRYPATASIRSAG